MRFGKEWLMVGAMVLPAFVALLPGQAAQIENVTFQESIEVGNVQFRLNNCGLMRYKVVIKAMVAGLYLEPGTKPKDALSDVGKRLEIQYFWDLKGKDISEAANKLLAQNLSPEEYRCLRPQLDRMNKLYRDVKPGDRYALTYIPGVGTHLTLNDAPQGTVEGAEFAAAYFQIWLGKQPMDAALRDQLLKPR